MAAAERPRTRSWLVPVVVVLAVIGLLSVIRFVIGLVTTVVVLAVVVGALVLLVRFLKGPPRS